MALGGKRPPQESMPIVFREAASDGDTLQLNNWVYLHWNLCKLPGGHGGSQGLETDWEPTGKQLAVGWQPKGSWMGKIKADVILEEAILGVKCC